MLVIKSVGIREWIEGIVERNAAVDLDGDSQTSCNEFIHFYFFVIRYKWKFWL